MQSQIDSLVTSTVARFADIPPIQRLLIAVAGIPGSGKTTLASRVVKGLNQSLGHEVAAMIPMDGYHLTRAQLSALPNPTEAHFRRGAYWTFSAPLLHSLIVALKAPLSPESKPIFAASFDHAVKDPVENDIVILPSHRILVFEGNYLALAEPKEWREVAELFDERWFVEVEEEVAKERLAWRHVSAGICRDYEEGVRRAEGNDLVNGRFVVENRFGIDRMLKSVEDRSFKEEEA